jgi:hypothetical protein
VALGFGSIRKLSFRGVFGGALRPFLDVTRFAVIANRSPKSKGMVTLGHRALVSRIRAVKRSPRCVNVRARVNLSNAGVDGAEGV